MNSSSSTGQFFCGSLILIAIFAGNVSPQRNTSLDTCESQLRKLAVVGLRFKDERNFFDLIIIGGSQRRFNAKYDRKRISDAVTYLSDELGVAKKRIVWGIGEDVVKNSYLKFYIGGELLGEINGHSRGKLCDALGEPLVP